MAEDQLAFLDELGYLDHQAVFAHGVELNKAEITRLADSQVAIRPQSYQQPQTGLGDCTSRSTSTSRCACRYCN